MFKSDYMQIAIAFLKTRPENANPNSIERRQWEKDVHAIERILAADNPRFNSHKFRQVVYSEPLVSL